jgi:hypothetical protein
VPTENLAENGNRQNISAMQRPPIGSAARKAFAIYIAFCESLNPYINSYFESIILAIRLTVNKKVAIGWIRVAINYGGLIKNGVIKTNCYAIF